MKSEFLYDEIIVIRLLQRILRACVPICARGSQLSSLLPVFLRASSLASRQLRSVSKWHKLPLLSYVNLRIYIRYESGKNEMVVTFFWRLSHKIEDVAYDRHPVHDLFRVIESRWHSLMTFLSTCLIITSDYLFFSIECECRIIY